MSDPMKVLDQIEQSAGEQSARAIDSEVRELVSGVERDIEKIVQRAIEMKQMHGWAWLGFESFELWARDAYGSIVLSKEQRQRVHVATIEAGLTTRDAAAVTGTTAMTASRDAVTNVTKAAATPRRSLKRQEAIKQVKKLVEEQPEIARNEIVRLTGIDKSMVTKVAQEDLRHKFPAEGPPLDAVTEGGRHSKSGPAKRKRKPLGVRRQARFEERLSSGIGFIVGTINGVWDDCLDQPPSSIHFWIDEGFEIDPAKLNTFLTKIRSMSDSLARMRADEEA